MKLSDAAKAGTALLVGGVQFTIVWFLSETTYPHYSVMSNYISDLGTACTSSGCYVPPLWLAFNGSEVVFGVLIVLFAYYFHRAFGHMATATVIAVAGLALMGTGTFNESFGLVHHLFSLVTFLLAGVAAIITYRFQKAPLSYISIILGLISLVSLALYVPDVGAFGNTLGIGPGGMERLIVYPVLLWSISFGGHLIGRD